MAKLRIGFLGAGYMSSVHGRNIMGLRGAEVAAVCDVNRQAAENLVTSLSALRATVYDDFGDMLNAADLDALYVCIPPGAHGGQVEAAAGAGLHLFLEKPIAIDARRGASMVRAVEKSGVVAAVGYMSRFGHAVEKLKGMIDDGSAGRPTLFAGRFWCNALHGPWWRDKKMCGGQVLEQAIHTYDMALHLLGEPEVVTGFAANLCHTDVENYTVEDTSTSVIRFKSGAMASIQGSNCAVPMEWRNDWQIVCENVCANFKSPNEAEFIYTSGPKVRRRTVAREKDVMLAEDKNFLAAIAGRSAPRATIQDGLLGVKLTSAVLKSAANDGRAVRFK